MKPSEGPAWRKDLADRAGLSEFVPHDGQVDPDVVGRSIGTWLESRGFETEVITSARTCIVKAHAREGWKKSIGARPSLEAEVRSAPQAQRSLCIRDEPEARLGLLAM